MVRETENSSRRTGKRRWTRKKIWAWKTIWTRIIRWTRKRRSVREEKMDQNKRRNCKTVSIPISVSRENLFISSSYYNALYCAVGEKPTTPLSQTKRWHWPLVATNKTLVSDCSSTWVNAKRKQYFLLMNWKVLIPPHHMSPFQLWLKLSLTINNRRLFLPKGN